MSHNQVLMSSITERAKLSYSGSPDDKVAFKDGLPTEAFLRWQAHWLEVARAVRAELEASGLWNRVSALNRVIGFVEKNSG
jgi:hypothetical protein